VSQALDYQSKNAWLAPTLAQRILSNRLLWPAGALIALLIYNLIFTPGFFHIEIRDGHLYGSLIDILANGTPVALLAIGMTLVIATGGVDLSVGSVMAISGSLVSLLILSPNADGLIQGYGWNFYPAVAVALVFALIVGICNGLLVTALKVQPIVATLIMMVAGRGIAQKITSGTQINFADSGFVFLGNGHLFALPFGVTLVAIVFALVALATRQTALGLAIESVGDSPTASRYVGLRVNTIKIAAYAVSALCAGVAGFVAASKIKTSDPINIGMVPPMELEAIFAVVIGGTALAGGRFTLVGSLLGAILLQTLGTTLLSTKIMGHDVRPEYLPLPKAVVIVVVCLLQSPKFRESVLRPFRTKGGGK
jgi:simple sugar transport system permease protein